MSFTTKPNLFILFSLFFSISVLSQSKSPIESLAKKAWEKLDSIKNEIGKSNQNMSSLDRYLFVDNLAKKKSDLALDFLIKYPQDENFQKVVDLFFHNTFRPLFIQENIQDSVRFELNKLEVLRKNAISKDEKEELLRKSKRLIPTDYVALGQWLQNGNEIAQGILESNTSLESKMNIKLKLFKRDIDLTLNLYQSLQRYKKERAFWIQFDKYYWEPYLVRIKGLLTEYSSFETIASFTQSFIGYVASYSPSLKEIYWKEFFEITKKSSEQKYSKAFQLLNKKAVENIAAIESFKLTNPNKPIEMEFVDMSGRKIKLSNLRGKVVLLDFWSIRCGPCIQELPHLAQLYHKYQEKGFEVIGISEDGDGAIPFIKEILKKNRASWPQYLDKGKDAVVSFHSLFNIKSLPTVWLLDMEGKIVDRNARGKRLEPLIRKHLGLEKLKFNYKNPSFNKSSND